MHSGFSDLPDCHLKQPDDTKRQKKEEVKVSTGGQKPNGPGRTKGLKKMELLHLRVSAAMTADGSRSFATAQATLRLPRMGAFLSSLVSGDKDKGAAGRKRHERVAGTLAVVGVFVAAEVQSTSALRYGQLEWSHDGS
ncbi:hypothetical protein H105_04090 [Trichophyton soudanense CBS 452.61]|uniref:Uncharacterized protein n=1 Tax=Trichophyton soudanense CBS 452.61 TaxID=1215331 RepID=A0A022XVU8_TRISD|nr:hypothetical protein H105_04090 [Trichophyton soudanense CBS 452.61]